MADELRTSSLAAHWNALWFVQLHTYTALHAEVCFECGAEYERVRKVAFCG